MDLRTLRWFFATLSLLLITGCSSDYRVFHPVGPVGRSEEFLINLSMALIAIVVVPVILLLVYIGYRFRDRPDNDAPYNPEYSESKTLEIIWWGIPIVIVAVLATFTVQKTFELTRPPADSGPPLTIQVVSLDWKWLFLYPDRNIATVNYCEIPTNRTVEFVLTSDAPMNSFWVPQLGGQEYTMPGMAMRLWLEADKPGDYFGSGAQFTGKGFAHMRFTVYARPATEFSNWTNTIKQAKPALSQAGYDTLAKPGVVQETAFSSYPKGIFSDIVRNDGGMYMKQDITK